MSIKNKPNWLVATLGNWLKIKVRKPKLLKELLAWVRVVLIIWSILIVWEQPLCYCATLTIGQ